MNWSGPASCIGTLGGCFCENHSILALGQPSNVVSAVGFFIATLLILRRRPHSPLAWVYATALFLVGFGTAYYHAKLTFLGQTIDFGGMNLVILIAPFQYWAQVRKGDHKVVWGSYALSVLASLAILVWLPEIRRGVFAVIVVAVLWLYGSDPKKIVPPEQRPWLWRGLAVFLFGYLFWNLDTYRIFCSPASWLQGHAVWHLTSAAASYCLYRMIESKTIK